MGHKYIIVDCIGDVSELEALGDSKSPTCCRTHVLLLSHLNSKSFTQFTGVFNHAGSKRVRALLLDSLENVWIRYGSIYL